ncbi:MAG: glutamate--tRNA ligase [Nitrososphaeria archaeon]|nr:glutamate--tRNA ligase [Nitrososphaeria archaeon]
MSSNKEVEELIRKYALENAVKFGGKCSPQAVLGKVFGERPDLKSIAKELVNLVRRISEEVNSLSLDEQKVLLSKYSFESKVVQPSKGEKVLPPLPDVEKYGTVVTRFAPNPDCVLHLGSARAIILSHDYARMYGGKFILRFEDTDPRLKKASLLFYDSIKEDLEWLGCEWDEEYIQSDRLPIYYEYARRLLEVGGAYVCTCESGVFKKLLLEKKPCPCRLLSSRENIERFDKMLDGTFGEGEAVLRIKTDLEHPNPAVRDWPALRIVDTKKHPHPRVGSKYRVWPLYNFSAGLDDHLMGITHIIRGKEHYTNMIRQKYMYAHLKWEYPTAIHYGRLKIEGGVLSKSKIMQGISKGLYSGFDDPRLATFKALRRRGILPNTIRQIIHEVNIKPVDATISWSTLYSINKKLVDPIAPRYFAVFDPIVLVIKNFVEEREIVLRKHPNLDSMGYRIIRLTPEDDVIKVYISKSDIELVKNANVFRLMGFANLTDLVLKDSVAEAKFHSFDMETAKKLNAPLIHWVPVNDCINVLMVTSEGSLIKGFGERGLIEAPLDSIVQLEREGFARVDSKQDNTIKLYFSTR